jgi:hypothetical protein
MGAPSGREGHPRIHQLVKSSSTGSRHQLVKSSSSNHAAGSGGQLPHKRAAGIPSPRPNLLRQRETSPTGRPSLRSAVIMPVRGRTAVKAQRSPWSWQCVEAGGRAAAQPAPPAPPALPVAESARAVLAPRPRAPTSRAPPAEAPRLGLKRGLYGAVSWKRRRAWARASPPLSEPGGRSCSTELTTHLLLAVAALSIQASLLK